jgi:hypothetical protein
MASNECDVPPETFWDIVTAFDVPPNEEPFWRRLLPLMAMCPHDPRTAPGVAFDDAGITPSRLERWLRVDNTDAWAQAPRLLDRVGESGIDWVSLGVLLCEWRQTQRYALAQDFFRSRYRRTSTQQGA